MPPYEKTRLATLLNKDDSWRVDTGYEVIESEFLFKFLDFLEARDQRRKRKSAIDTIRQNVEICDLRRKDSKTWSMPRLGRKFDMTRQSVAKILKDEAKWRQLFAKLPKE